MPAKRILRLRGEIARRFAQDAKLAPKVKYTRLFAYAADENEASETSKTSEVCATNCDRIRFGDLPCVEPYG